jgi:VIT1/CCC1 family predicted Fe2+/Mn2+ transporter
MQPDKHEDQDARAPRDDRSGKQRSDVENAYEIVADVVGGVPSLRWKDNLIQGLAILGSVILGAIIGLAIVREFWGALTGALAGLIAGLILSGMVLMVLGWVRTARKATPPSEDD